MIEQDLLQRMISPGMVRPGKPMGGVIQILITRACNLACIGCTQGSQLAGRTSFMSPAQFAMAVDSLEGYFGVVGVFGGNPCLSPHFGKYCEILKKRVPQSRCGLWSNNLNGYGNLCRTTFNPCVSNLNAHMVEEAYEEMVRDWPESRPFGLSRDSRHSPCYVAMKDVVPDEAERNKLISRCDINHHWSAGIAVFRGELRGYFCEIAMAQSQLHQYEDDYPDTGLAVDRLYDDGEKRWWELPMHSFTGQVRKHCHECSVPLKGFGELAQSRLPESREQVSVTHQEVFKPKRKDRRVELVTVREQLGSTLPSMVRYLQNAEL